MWIAFKIVSLTYQKQRSQEGKRRRLVVNCFQNCIFDLSKTAIAPATAIFSKLWIAFKIVSLTYQKQLDISLMRIADRCELLSKLYLWLIKNSQIKFNYYGILVVNCFQNCIFDLSKTAFNTVIKKLWSCELLSKLYLWLIKNS